MRRRPTAQPRPAGEAAANRALMVRRDLRAQSATAALPPTQLAPLLPPPARRLICSKEGNGQQHMRPTCSRSSSVSARWRCCGPAWLCRGCRPQRCPSQHARLQLQVQLHIAAAAAAAAAAAEQHDRTSGSGGSSSSSTVGLWSCLWVSHPRRGPALTAWQPPRQAPLPLPVHIFSTWPPGSIRCRRGTPANAARLQGG